MGVSIEELDRLVAAKDWKAAEAYAKEIAFACRMCWMEETPPLHFHSAPRRSIPHPQRIRALLCRLSRRRVIWAKEANEIQLRLAKKWSGNASLTYEATRLVEGRFYSDHSWSVQYFAVGKLCYGTFVWDELYKEAMNNGCKFVLFSERRKRQLRALRRLEERSLNAKTFINKVKKEISGHVKNAKDGWRSAGVSGEHHAGSEGRINQG